MKQMRGIIILTITLILFSSCNHEKKSDLKNQIMILQNQNQVLRDSIAELEHRYIYAFHILGIPEKNNLKVNEPTTIDFIFGYKDYIKSYNVYRLTGENEDDRELILKNQEISKFKYSFTPKDKNDNRIKLMVEFNLGNSIIGVPADVTLNVTE